MSNIPYLLGAALVKSANTADLIHNFEFEKLADSVSEYLVGTVKEKDGFVFLDIPNKIIDAFTPLIDDPKAEKPPTKTGDSDVGAHITLIKQRESAKLDKIKGIGNKCKFTITGLKSVVPAGWPEMDKCWFLECKSQDLENVRKDNDLSPLVDGDHQFHISLAVRKK